MSSGRMTLIACTGTARGERNVRELQSFRMSYAEKVARTEEAIELIRLASTGGPVDFDGRGAYLREAILKPDFVQTPMPIWMAANPPVDASDEALDKALGRVARLGEGWMTFAISPAELKRRIELVNRLRGELGRSEGPFPICVYIDINVSTDRDAAFDDAIITCQLEGRQNATKETLSKTAAIGTAADCADVLRRLIDAGATSIALRPVTQRPGEQLDRLTSEVLSLVESR
jgi:alkanesulfonate monooxygenase SsuD/methylene tetrahydromethanopterin reductase-like flavin-dependent oxidoreductase (luciferase family)